MCQHRDRECEASGQVVLGTNFRGWTAPDKQGNRKRRVFCRDCDRSWVVAFVIDHAK